MKKIIGVALAAACTCPSQAAGEQNKLDTTRVNNLNEVVVKAVRAPKSSPFAVENINKGSYNIVVFLTICISYA
uniref:hypothetical protein n=1 Tax=Leyella stercorea TaxID=363265 RepID=UPI002666C935